MVKELISEDVEFKVNLSGEYIVNDDYCPQYEEIYNRINEILLINKAGFNLYIIDDFSKDNLDKITAFIQKNIKRKSSPGDICYVNGENEKKPKCIKTANGEGILLKTTLKKIKDLYAESIYKFYNDLNENVLDRIISEIEINKNKLIDMLIKNAHDAGFDIKQGEDGFSFIPIYGNKVITEEEYDRLDAMEKERLLEKLRNLKVSESKLIREIKEIENQGINKIKMLLKRVFDFALESEKKNFILRFKDNDEIVKYLKNTFSSVEQKLIDACSGSFEEDEEKFIKIISKYNVNVIVDNSNNNFPIVFEDDPSISNLIGSIGFKNADGNYVTDMSFIKAGSLLRANNGCLIMRIDSLLLYPSSYYYLKKILLNKKVDFSYNNLYLELLSADKIKPECIDIEENVILIGDEETYSKLFYYDKDFRNIFNINAEAKSLFKIDRDMKAFLFNYIENYMSDKSIKILSQQAISELIKVLCRKAESREEILFKEEDINKILLIANEYAEREEKYEIEDTHIIKAAYKQSIIEKEMLEQYDKRKIFIQVKNRAVGQINGLSVIDIGYESFGKPVRISCSCFKGSGEIIDVQKINDLSGRIHSKSVSILKGYLSNILEEYSGLSVDFNICFEQVYGKIDGDSASVAEILSMLSAISKIPIKQNLAITGSLDQFGNIQPVGGINDKIEGFFNVCKLMDGYEGKGVVIPHTNADNIVISKEIEEAVKTKKFHIFTVENVGDAANIMMGDKNLDWSKIIKVCKEEINKFRNGSNIISNRKAAKKIGHS
jgi:predicted ATP-dependent protease